MADLVVSGRFLDPDGSVESPLSGRVVFTASVPMILEEGVRRARVVTARLDKEGFLCRPDSQHGVVLSGPGEGVEPSAWSWRVEFELTSRRGGRVGFDGFWIPASSGALDLRDATPVPDPDTGEYVVRGEPGRPGPMGVSVESVERAGNDTEARAVFHLTDKSTHEVALPRGPQGVSVASITSAPRAGFVRVSLTDGTSSEVPATVNQAWTREAQAKAQGYWEVVSTDEPESPTVELSDGTVLPVKWSKPVTKLVPVFPEPPQWNDYDGLVLVPEMVGLSWQVKGGKSITPGQWVKVAPEELPADVTVQAVPQQGYQLLSVAEWVHSFPNTTQETVFTSESFDRADAVLTKNQVILTDASLGGTPVPWRVAEESSEQVGWVQFKDGQLVFGPRTKAGAVWCGMAWDVWPENWILEFDLTQWEGVNHGSSPGFMQTGYTGSYGNVRVRLYHPNGADGGYVDLQWLNHDTNKTENVILVNKPVQTGHYKFTKYRNTFSVETPMGGRSISLTGHRPEFKNAPGMFVQRGSQSLDQVKIAFDNWKVTKIGF